MSRQSLARVGQVRAALASGRAREQRITAGVRVHEVAAELGVTPQAVSQWESGRRVPDAVNALAYARLMDAVTRRAALTPRIMLMWEPTGKGGFRRTGVAQGKSAAQITRRPVRRKHPPVLIRLGERLGLPDCPYVIRWCLEVPFGSVRLHHWLAADDDRAFHDHPWWFTILVLHGGYTDKSPDGDDHLHTGSVRYRPALHRHTVVPDKGGAWTLLVTGPPVRHWGFWRNGKFRKANKWFLTYGHHPCAALTPRRRPRLAFPCGRVHGPRPAGTFRPPPPPV